MSQGWTGPTIRVARSCLAGLVQGVAAPRSMQLINSEFNLNSFNNMMAIVAAVLQFVFFTGYDESTTSKQVFRAQVVEATNKANAKPASDSKLPVRTATVTPARTASVTEAAITSPKLTRGITLAIDATLGSLTGSGAGNAADDKESGTEVATLISSKTPAETCST